MPCRSSRSSASARRSGSAPAKRRSVRDQRPCVAVTTLARRREKRRGRRSGFGTPKRRPARSGVQASFVTSPAQTRSQSAGSASSSARPVSSSRSSQKSAPCSSAARSCRAARPRARRTCDLAEHGGVLAEVEGDAVEAGADPDDLAARAERVEVLGPVAGHAPRQQLGLPQRDGQRQRLQRDERLAQRRAAVDPVPRRQEARERLLLDRLDLAAQRRERRAPQAAQHVGVAPLALGAARAKLAAHEQLVALELGEHRRRRRGRSARSPRAVVNGPRPLREAQDELAQRLRPALEEHVGQARRRHHAERVAVAAGVLGGDQALLARDPHERPRAARRAAARRAPGRTRRHAGRRAGAACRAARRVCAARRAAGARPPRPRRRRAGRGAPPGRAARAAGRGRARAPARAARPAACRPRTCTSRRSRRGARPSTARRCRVSTSTRSSCARLDPVQQRRAARAGRRRPAGTRGRSRARPGRSRSGAPPGGATAP